MSLAEAVLEIADEMEKVADDETISRDSLQRELLSWIKQIRRLCKVSGGVSTPGPEIILGRVEKVLGGTHLPTPAGSVISHTMGNVVPARAFDPWPLAEKERLEREARKVEQRALEEASVRLQREEAGSDMAYLVGGLSEGDLLPIQPSMPVGGKTMVAGQVYVLGKDKKLHFSQEDTTRWNERKK
jgi:hypothetical protein